MTEVIAETRGGKVRGSIQKGYENCEFYAFKGIPYAKPPVRNLRFRDPEPVEPWTGIREATTFGSSCAQFHFLLNKLEGNDDCLYVNVYTKDMKFRVGRPVIVSIHSGLFLYASGDDLLYGPDYFMHKDVVLVTFNYRLGVFGFLNLGDEEACGNQGFKDQVMALKWVRDNISNFGGDPNNVTITGISSGSASAHYLTISPLAKGLFHKAILQSGTVLNPWAFLSDPKEGAYKLCEFLGHREKDPKSIINFLRTIDAQQLAMAQEKIETDEDKIQMFRLFGPSIDAESNKPFMPVHPEIAASEAIQVPLIIGQTDREGLFYIKRLTETMDRFDKEINKILHPAIIANLSNSYNLTTEGVKRIYFKDSPITEENLEKLIDLYGDLYYVEGTHRVVKTQVEKGCSPTYLYRFSHDKRLSDAEPSGSTKISGASHARELQYLFEIQYLPLTGKDMEDNSEKRRITEQMIELWVNFATTGNPTPKISDLIPLYWQPVNNQILFNYLDINKELRMDKMLNLKQRYVADASSKI